MLIKRGASPHLQNHYKHSALMLAARNGHIAVVRLLLAAGADVEQRSYEGITALQHALACDRTECAELLRTTANKVRARAHLKRHVPIVQHACAAWLGLFEEVRFRPGNSGFFEAMASFKDTVALQQKKAAADRPAGADVEGRE